MLIKLIELSLNFLDKINSLKIHLALWLVCIFLYCWK